MFPLFLQLARPGGPFGAPRTGGGPHWIRFPGPLAADPAPQYVLCIAVWCLALLLVISGAKHTTRRPGHRMLALGFAAGLFREVFSLALDVVAPRPMHGALLSPGVLPAIEAWVQGAALILLVAGFLSYLAERHQTGERYLRIALPVYTGAFVTIVVCFLAATRPVVFGFRLDVVVAGLVALGFCLVAASLPLVIRCVSVAEGRWIMVSGILFFLAGISVRGLAFIGSSLFRPPMDVPYSVTASAIGVVLLGYLFVRRHAAEVRADINVLEEQVRERTSHLERALEELEIANSKLVEQSTIDAVTGAYNRRYFDEALEREWVRSVRTGAHLSLALVDLDSFKAINDRFGHPKGDDCLLAVANMLQGRLRRPGDVVARYGGDEFAVILPNTSESGAYAVLDAIRESVEQLSLPPASALTVSIGVASRIPDDNPTRDSLLQTADERLYAAKQSGRNRVVAGSAKTATVA
ncbi:MAG: GGDEF domain-containing protein [Acidobacteria bacterium]|nr:GGDEF domain-containing protein [Acidobacteriota bacterium]